MPPLLAYSSNVRYGVRKLAAESAYRLQASTSDRDGVASFAKRR
jgi:hypothetical protein